MRGNTYANRYRKFGEWAVIGLERTGSWIDRASSLRRLSSHVLFLLGLPLTAWVWVGADFWPWGLPAAASVPLASALLLPTPHRIWLAFLSLLGMQIWMTARWMYLYFG